MPVYASKVSLPSGEIWANLLIRNDAIKVKHHFTEVVADDNSAQKWLTKQAFKYWKSNLSSFLKQRQKALMEVNAYNQMHELSILRLQNINKNPSHNAWCKDVVVNQQHLMILLPAIGSRFSSWRYIIHEMVQYSHSNLTAIEKEVYSNLIKP